MLNDFPCVNPDQLADLEQDCPFRLEQVVRFGIQRLKKDDGSLNVIEIATSNPTLETTWTALKAKTDSEKLIVTGLVQEIEPTVGDATKYESDTLVGGFSISGGSEPTKVIGYLFDKSAKEIAGYKAIFNNPNESIGLFFITEANQIVGQSDDVTTPTTLMPIPIHERFIKDLSFKQDRKTPNKWELSFAMAGGWSDKLYSAKAAFDAVNLL